MMRTLKQTIGFLFGVLLSLAFLAPYAYAETIAATVKTPGTYTVPPVASYNLTNSPGSWSTFAAARSQGYSVGGWTQCGSDCVEPPLTSDSVYSACSGQIGTGVCSGRFSIGQFLNCPSGYTKTPGSPPICTNSNTVYICPSGQNWTLSGTSCTRPDCVSPAIRDGSGVCVSPATCSSQQTYNSSTNTCSCKTNSSFSGTVSAGSSAGVVCGGGCESLVVQASNQYQVGGVQVIKGTWTTTGNPCSGQSIADTSSLPEKTTCPSGQCGGTVNGVQVCVSCTSDQPAQSTTVQDKSTTNPDGSTTSEKVTVTQTDDGTGNIKTTTTTTTTTIPAGGGAGTTTQSTTTSSGPPAGSGVADKPSTSPVGPQSGESTEDLNDVLRACAERPDLPICKDYCSKPENAGKAQCADLGEHNDTDVITENELGTNSITVQSFGSAGSCPADIPLPYGAHFSFQPTCDFMSAIRPFLLAFAWLSAGLMVIGAVRSS